MRQALICDAVRTPIGRYGGALSGVRLYPVTLGYGDNLRSSGTPRLETRTAAAGEILQQIVQRTAAFGLPALSLKACGGGASCIAVPGR